MALHRSAGVVSRLPSHEKQKMETTPFPWLPMLAIAIGLVSHSYALTSLFPYVGYMVQHLGVTDDKDEAGYYAGYVSSAFMVGRVGSSYFWGRFADSHGRLPVIYAGLTSMVVLSIAFGLSTSFLWALGCRFLLGVLNGLLGISKAMTSEVCGKEHEATGMAYVLGCASIGLVIGPGLGGLLAEPATHYPTVFSQSGLFGRFPYLLPNIVGAGIALTGLPFVFFFLKETRHVHNNRGDSSGEFKLLSVSEAGTVETHEAATVEEGGMVEMTPTARTQNTLESDTNGSGRDNILLADRRAEGSRAVRYDGGIEGRSGTADCYDIDEDHGRNSGEQSRQLLSASGRSSNDDYVDDGDERDEAAAFGAGGGRKSNRERFRTTTRALQRLEKAKGFGDSDSGGEGRWGRRSTCWRECLVPIQLLTERRTRNVMFVYALFSFVAIGNRELYPLWALSTVASGGLDWSSKQIGQALSVCGIFMLFFQLLVYPRLSKRIGATRSQRWACFLSIPVFLVFPTLSHLRGTERTLVAASLVLLFLTNAVANTVFINVALATNNAVEPSRRGTLTGLSMTTGSLAKAAGPTFFSSIFAWSIDGRRRPFPLDYHLAFYLLALGMVLVSWASWGTICSPEPVQSQSAACVVPARDRWKYSQEREYEYHGGVTAEKSLGDASKAIPK
ncbi:conserved unknown protein [Ectocarpus siliculosus]|uniref:Major facilitator superfamily (MFS) profile domain-containing protein n=1 Tax=Ectocarpus siliculosus TaxID=2880 RepID=D8LRH9_ECTSI|nr:conserved unknown protein [Ectocarpus siliculosus]|eukprot:CBN75080.1 conserved unknown protein [Ectocarpus siliculosus]